jgi:hypothetical protein
MILGNDSVMQNISIRDEIKDLSPLKKVETKLTFLYLVYINQGRMKSTFPVYTDKKGLGKSRPNTMGAVVL